MHVNQYSIKRLQFPDLKECAHLYVKVFNSEPWNDHWTIKTAFSRLKEIYNTPGFFGIKAICDKYIIGIILGNIESWYEDYNFQLKEIYTDPDFQSTGIGTDLIKKIINDLKKRSVRVIYLYTSSNKRLQKFYQKNGFTILPFMKMMKHDMNIK